MKQLLSPNETVVIYRRNSCSMDYATVVPCLLYTFDMRWYDSDNGDYCGKISVFLMKKQRLSATYLPQIARKRPKTTCFEPTFSQKRVIFLLMIVNLKISATLF